MGDSRTSWAIEAAEAFYRVCSHAVKQMTNAGIV